MKNLKFAALGSGSNSNAMKKYKESLGSLSKVQFDASIGLMLGDASLQTQNKGKTFRLKFEWGEKNKPYLDHVFTLFNEWVLSEPHKKSRVSPSGNTVVNWGFQTISHTAFNPLAELFNLKSVPTITCMPHIHTHNCDCDAGTNSDEKNRWPISDPTKLTNQMEGMEVRNKKGINPHLILDHLTGRGLAYWFMDDGGKLDYNKNSKNKGVVLNTQSFTTEEVELMSKQLSVKFNLECEVRSNKGKKVIVIKSTSYGVFRSLVDPYIIPEMSYKLP